MASVAKKNSKRGFANCFLHVSFRDLSKKLLFGGFMVFSRKTVRSAWALCAAVLCFGLSAQALAQAKATPSGDSMNGRRSSVPDGEAWYLNDLSSPGYWAYLAKTGQLKRGVASDGSHSKISPIFDPDNGFVVAGEIGRASCRERVLMPV